MDLSEYHCDPKQGHFTPLFPQVLRGLKFIYLTGPPLSKRIKNMTIKLGSKVNMKD